MSMSQEKHLESNENTFGGATYDNQCLTPGLISPENILSREINAEDYKAVTD